MAAVGSRALTQRTFGFFRHSFNLVRTFSASPHQSTTSAAAAAAAADPSTTPKKSKRKKKKNLFEVAQFLPNWGVGYKMAKSHWRGVSYQITKINLYKDGRHGKAWGVVHKEGLPAAADTPKKISGVHKRCWKYIPDAKKTVESTPKPEELQA